MMNNSEIMYNSNTSSISSENAESFLSNQEYFEASLVIDGIALVLSFSGIIFNCINIRIFISMGVRDSVTVSFLSLACTDLLLSLSTFAWFLVTALILHQATHGVWYNVDLYAVGFLIANVGLAITTSTILNTVFISAARCVCVLKPLQYRNIFTKFRACLAVASINGFSIAIYLPIFALSGTMKKFDPVRNESMTVLWLSPHREKVKDGTFMLIKIALPFGAQVLLIACVAVMARALIKSTKVRQAMSDVKSDELGENATSTTKLSGKELQAVRQVFLIAIVFILCNVPAIVGSLVGITLPGFDTNIPIDRFWRMYIVSHYIQRAFEQLNSSVNIVFYYLYNTKFRMTLKALCCCRIEVP